MKKYIGSLLVLAMTLFLSGAAKTLASTVSSQIYKGSKTVTFDVTNKNKDAAYSADDSGGHYYATHAFAHDAKSGEWNSKHNYLPYSNEFSEGCETFKGLRKPVRYETGDKGEGKGSIKTFKLYSTELLNFDQGKDGTLLKNKSVSVDKGRSTGYAGLDMSHTKPEKQEDKNQWLATGKIDIRGSASVEVEGKGLRIAESFAFAKMGFTGWGKTDEKGRGTSSLWEKHFTANIWAKASRSGSKPKEGDSEAKVHDPVMLDVIDELTGEILAHQDLYQETWNAEGTASVSWFDEQELDEPQGLLLSVLGNLDPDPENHTDSIAGIVFETLSDWILNPINGAVSLNADGVFETTGDLDGLAWVISTTPEGYYQAFLPLSEWRPEYEFEVQPYDLAPNRDVLLNLYSPFEGYTEAVVPEPASIALLGLAGLALLRYRRG